jgi:hypothetical protein
VGLPDFDLFTLFSQRTMRRPTSVSFFCGRNKNQ